MTSAGAHWSWGWGWGGDRGCRGHRGRSGCLVALGGTELLLALVQLVLEGLQLQVLLIAGVSTTAELLQTNDGPRH